MGQYNGADIPSLHDHITGMRNILLGFHQMRPHGRNCGSNGRHGGNLFRPQPPSHILSVEVDLLLPFSGCLNGHGEFREQGFNFFRRTVSGLPPI